MSSGAHIRAFCARLSQAVIPFAAAVMGSALTLHLTGQEEQAAKIISTLAVNTQAIEDLAALVISNQVVSRPDARPAPYKANLIQSDTSSAINQLLGGIDDDATDEDAAYLYARKEAQELEQTLVDQGEKVLDVQGPADADTGKEVRALEVVKPVSNEPAE